MGHCSELVRTADIGRFSPRLGGITPCLCHTSSLGCPHALQQTEFEWLPYGLRIAPELHWALKQNSVLFL